MPDERGVKPYRLLLEAMRETEMVALGRLVLRAKEHLVAIRAADEVLTLETMVFADEIVSPDRFAELDGEVKTSDREVAIAKQLIESLSGPFEPEKYHDEYREQVLALIDRKASGEEIVLQPSGPRREGRRRRPDERPPGQPRGGQEAHRGRTQAPAQGRRATAPARRRPASRAEPAPGDCRHRPDPQTPAGRPAGPVCGGSRCYPCLLPRCPHGRGRAAPSGARMTSIPEQPAAGLYDPRYEHDACGVALVARLDNVPTHEVDPPRACAP